MSKEFLQETSRLSEIREIISAVREIAEKDAGEKAGWLNAFDGVLFRVEAGVYDPRLERELGRERYFQALDLLKQLREDVNRLKLQRDGENFSEGERDDFIGRLQEVGGVLADSKE
ncbi:MAG: hypothetical protein HYW90_01225 [Candidatus Sungbacteria bacterium]|nr:hypothetical protein [Candidatus Sungbacteria bacterium]